MGEAQGLDLGELGILGEGGQHLSELVQGRVQVVHAVPLPVVGFQPPGLLDLHDHLSVLGGAPGPVPLGLVWRGEERLLV